MATTTRSIANLIDDLPELLEVDVDEIEDFFENSDNKQALEQAVISAARSVYEGKPLGGGLTFTIDEMATLASCAFQLARAQSEPPLDARNRIQYVYEHLEPIWDNLVAKTGG